MLKKLLAPTAVTLAILAAATMLYLSASADDSYTRIRTTDNVSIRYFTDEVPIASIQTSYIDIPEKEIFTVWSTDIFGGTIVEIRNIVIDFGEYIEYCAFVMIEVADVIRGDLKPGALVTVLIRSPIRGDGSWLESHALPMKTGMKGIFMPRKNDESIYWKRGDSTLYLMEFVRYGFPDTFRFVFLETTEGVVYSSTWGHTSAGNVKTLDDVRKYINRMIS